MKSFLCSLCGRSLAKYNLKMICHMTVIYKIHLLHNKETPVKVQEDKLVKTLKVYPSLLLTSYNYRARTTPRGSLQTEFT